MLGWYDTMLMDSWSPEELAKYVVGDLMLDTISLKITFQCPYSCLTALDSHTRWEIIELLWDIGSDIDYTELVAASPEQNRRKSFDT